ncbi:hypothetical protein H6501_04960 [Candidatus Woesearchaeota archaeon]|nr:hypothetical protein [Nanoarchaeota archaeon]MCB9370923.1 hypothetical protein [Candidatus Woesearchaeota archaeon]USN44024.1 MAG: hypothetical protein H6500_06565 [Candidatus Woesearchaeota archaeon]
MSEEVQNPFELKKSTTNWADMAKKRLEQGNSEQTEKTQKTGSSSKPRVAKSFKIFPGDLSRAFDKRVNKMQVHFDDEGKEKNFVDSGKYVMFLMAFAERYGVWDMYTEVDGSGDISLDAEKLKDFAKKLLESRD